MLQLASIRMRIFSLCHATIYQIIFYKIDFFNDRLMQICFDVVTSVQDTNLLGFEFVYGRYSAAFITC